MYALFPDRPFFRRDGKLFKAERPYDISNEPFYEPNRLLPPTNKKTGFTVDTIYQLPSTCILGNSAKEVMDKLFEYKKSKELCKDTDGIWRVKPMPLQRRRAGTKLSNPGPKALERKEKIQNKKIKL